MRDIDWSAVRGVNYLPSYGRDQMEAWLACFEPEILAREIGFARRLGFDTIRVWLSFDAYLAGAERFMSNLQLFADTCHQRGLRLIPIAFGACGTERRDEGEKRLSLSEVREQMKAEDPEVPALKPSQAQLLGALLSSAFPGDVEVPYSGDPGTIFWHGWRQSPGNSRLGEAWRPKIRAYLEALVKALGRHPAILAWDVMNEPLLTAIASALGEGQQVDVLPFLKWASGTLAELDPSAPLTVGCIQPEEMERYDELTEGALGLLSCHSYSRGEDLDRYFDKAQSIADRRGKPWLLTECGNFEFPGNPAIETDEAEDKIYADILPRLTKASIGWVCFHLIMGYGPFSGMALLWPNGTRRPAAHRLARWLVEHDGRQAELRTEAPSRKG